MRRLGALAGTILVAMTLVAAPGQAVRSEGGTYVAGEGLFFLWCGPGPHPLVPQDTPWDHSSPEAWLFSGKPQCAPADARNAARQALGEPAEGFGINGFMWHLIPGHDFARNAVVRATDAVHGTDVPTRLETDGYEAAPQQVEGCGAQVIHILPGLLGGWDVPVLYDFIPAIYITDGLSLCFASTGHVEATFGLA